MRAAVALALALVTGAASAATPWSMDAAASRLTFTATQAGARFTGRFTRFDADIRFDALDPATSRMAVRIATASVDTYDEQRDSALRGPDFFWSEAYPEALFTAQRVSAAGTGWIATGQLTLRGVTRPVSVHFAFAKLPDGSARLEGSATLRRLDFGVGQGEWSSTQWAGDGVDVAFALRLTPAEVTAGP